MALTYISRDTVPPELICSIVEFDDDYHRLEKTYKLPYEGTICVGDTFGDICAVDSIRAIATDTANSKIADAYEVLVDI